MIWSCILGVLELAVGEGWDNILNICLRVDIALELRLEIL